MSVHLSNISQPLFPDKILRSRAGSLSSGSISECEKKRLEIIKAWRSLCEIPSKDQRGTSPLFRPVLIERHFPMRRLWPNSGDTPERSLTPSF